MRHTIRASSLVPDGFVVEGVSNDFVGPLLTVRAANKISKCPGCGAASARIHSRYRRRRTDLPVGSKPVRIVILNGEVVYFGGCINFLTPSCAQMRGTSGMAPNSCLVEIEKWTRGAV